MVAKISVAAPAPLANDCKLGASMAREKAPIRIEKKTETICPASARPSVVCPYNPCQLFEAFVMAKAVYLRRIRVVP